MNPQATTPYGGQTTRDPGRPEQSKPDTTTQRLAGITATLSQCEDVLLELSEKLRGPLPPSGSGQPEAAGINDMILDINSRAQRLLEGLRSVSQELG